MTPSQLVPEWYLRTVEWKEAHGMGGERDARLLAVYEGVEIWHTAKTDKHDPPDWPPGSLDQPPIHRGFAVGQLGCVLNTGLDVPSSSAFFATYDRLKAWKYSSSSSSPSIAAMMILDGSKLERSWAVAGPSVDRSRYARSYRDASSQQIIYSRFPEGHCTETFLDEMMYGFFAPSPREALLGVVLGGPEREVQGIVEQWTQRRRGSGG